MTIDRKGLISGFRKWLESGYPGLASEIAFYMLLSVFPAILIFSSALTFLPNCKQSYEDIIQIIHSLLPPLVANLIDQGISGTKVCGRAQSGALSIGIVTIVFVGSNVFSVLTRAMNRAYGIPERRNFFFRRIVAVVFFLGTILTSALALPLFFIGSHIGERAAHVFNLSAGIEFWQAMLAPTVTLIGILGMTVLYKYGPAWKVKTRAAATGAGAAIFGILLVSIAFRIGVGRIDHYKSLYGVIAAPIALMIWLYLVSFVMLLGGFLVGRLSGEGKSINGP